MPETLPPLSVMVRPSLTIEKGSPLDRGRWRLFLFSCLSFLSSSVAVAVDILLPRCDSVRTEEKDEGAFLFLFALEAEVEVEVEELVVVDVDDLDTGVPQMSGFFKIKSSPFSFLKGSLDRLK